MITIPRAFAVSVPFVAACLWSGPSHAEQVVVFDQTWVHTPDLPDSHFRMPPGGDAPVDWTSPIDYSQGSAWVYLEVHTKPTEQETKFQVCFEATPTYACTLQSPTYTDVGTIEWESTFDQFWSPEGEFVDWTQGVNNIACILKDTMNGKPSADNVGPEVAALYTPTEVRLVVTLVEAGSVYEPPTPTGDTTGTEGGSEGSTDDGGDTIGATTSGGADETSASATAADDAPADDDGSVSASASATETASATDASESSDTGPSVDDDEGSGCSCTAGGDGIGAFGLVALVLVGRSRRRRSLTADARR